jgi:hypothetical protein
MKSYEYAEAYKAYQDGKIDSAIVQQNDGSWWMSLMNPSNEISVVELPNVDAPKRSRPVDHFQECECEECEGLPDLPTIGDVQ